MWKTLIVCNGPSCQFSDLIVLIQNLIHNLIVFSTFLAVAAFAWAGFLLLTSGGSESAKTKAKDVFVKVMKGYLWILAAWLLVYTITSILIKPEFASLLGAPK